MFVRTASEPGLPLARNAPTVGNWSTDLVDPTAAASGVVRSSVVTGTVTASVSSPSVAMVGQVGALLNASNRARVPSSAAASTQTWSTRTYHNLFCGTGKSLSAISIAWANWSGAEIGTGGSMTVKCWIEYPLGVATRQQVTFGGLTTGTIADGGTLYCDVTTLTTPIPDGAKVGIWAELVPSVAIPFSTVKGKSTAWGDAVTNTGPAMTASSTFTDSAGAGFQGPCSVRGLIYVDSIYVAGDSRNAGIHDQAGSDGLNGQIPRIFGPRYPVLNAGSPGETGASFVSTHTKRLALANDCTYLVWAYGENDMAFGASAATCEATATTAKGLFPATMRKTRATIPPSSDSTNNWTAADGSDQTPKSYMPAVHTYNNGAVANTAGWAACYDLASVNELAPQTGKWLCNGVANDITDDGIHEVANGAARYAPAFPTLL